MDYELVRFLDTNGAPLVWEPGMELPAFQILMRKRLDRWVVSGFEPAIPVPGGPPRFTPLSFA